MSFSTVPLGACRAAVDAAMAGIDDDGEALAGRGRSAGRARSLFGVACGRAGGLRPASRAPRRMRAARPPRCPPPGGSRATSSFGRMSSLSTTNGPLAVRIRREVPVVDVPVADIPDQPPRLQLLGVDGESGLRQVDDQPVRAAQQEPSRVGLAVEIHDDAHVRRVAGHLVVMRFERGAAGDRRRAPNRRAKQQAESRGKRAAAASSACPAERLITVSLPTDTACLRRPSGMRRGCIDR